MQKKSDLLQVCGVLETSNNMVYRGNGISYTAPEKC